jgi:hypothetical protein
VSFYASARFGMDFAGLRGEGFMRIKKVLLDFLKRLTARTVK